jgi:hypothetical protein
MPVDRARVEHAIATLCDPHADEGFAAIAHLTLATWRAAHQAPVNLLQSVVRSRLPECGVHGATIGGRQKRVPTILDKIRRLPHYKPWQFQDIGGVRVVVDTTGQVDALVENLIARRPIGFEQFRAPTDYLRSPRATGYRSFHLMYEYRAQLGEPPHLDGLHVELQIRTRRQHWWATANEVVGFSLDQQLKYAQGDPRWLRFFELAGSVFAQEDGLPVAQGLEQDAGALKAEFLALRDELNVIEELNKFGIVSVPLKVLEVDKNSPYYLLEIHRRKGMISMRPYPADAIEQAVRDYQAAEAAALNDTSIDVLLVSAENWSEIRTIYQNYFTDTDDFRAAIYSIVERDAFDNVPPPWKTRG